PMDSLLPSPSPSSSQVLSIPDTSRYGRPRIPTAKCQPTSSTSVPIVKRSMKGRKPKATVLILTTSALAIVEGENVKEALDEAVTTVKPVEVVDEVQMLKPEGGDTQATITVNKSVRSAELKDIKELKRKEVNGIKKYLKGLTTEQFKSEISNVQTVTFNALATGADMEARPQLSDTIDLSNLYTLFSQFWPENQWEIIADNTNRYAILQDVFNPSKEEWYPTNSNEIKVFVGVIIHMGCSPLKRTTKYWGSDLKKSSIHTPALFMSKDRYHQLHRYLHVSSPISKQDELTEDQEDSMDQDEKLPWGTLVAIPVDDVLCLGWIDNNTVLALPTVHTVNQAGDVKLRWRRRPADTSTNAKNARKPFSDQPRAELEIPRCIDDYSYHIGGVDIADQHRAAYMTQRKALRTWWPLFYRIIDHICITAFKIAVKKEAWKKTKHLEFRERLCQQLFEYASTRRKRKWEDELGSKQPLAKMSRIFRDPLVLEEFKLAAAILDDWDGNLKRVKDAENAFRNDSDVYNTLEIKSTLIHITKNQERILQDKENKKCLQDLYLTNPYDDKKRIEQTKGGLLQDSYRWILDNSDFRQWRKNQQSRLLWIKGDPGKGKTMLLCGIINELKKPTTHTCLLSFFFCQATDARINSATAILRGLIYLLIDQQPSLISHVRKKYDHAGKALFEDANA
ncbi:MAG: hypothetical protein Q9190_007350, partial [Brigantiaea leucoxantha]